MKKTYGTPLVEKIEFDFSDTVTASNTMVKETYRDSNAWYDCHSSLKPDEACGFALSGGIHTSNATYDCGK